MRRVSATSYSPAASKRPYNRKSHRRRGAVLLAVMVCIFVSIALVATAISSSTAARRETKIALHRQQAVLLLDYGVDRLRSMLDAPMLDDNKPEDFKPEDFIPEGTGAEDPNGQPSPAQLSSLDVSGAFEDYQLAQIEYERVDESTEPMPEITSQAAVRIRCTVRLSRHSSDEPEFTLSREIRF